MRISSRRALPAVLVLSLLAALTTGTGSSSAETPAVHPVPLPVRSQSAAAPAQATPFTAKNKFLAAGGGVAAPPVSVNDHLYVSTGATLATWDMSGAVPKGPFRPSTTPEDGSITAMAAPRRYLYAATLAFTPAPDINVSGGGISTYSLADPSHPARIGHTTLPNTLGYSGTPHSLAATDRALYAVDEYGSLYTYSLADPKTPQFTGTVADPTNFYSYLNQASGATVVGNSLIVTGFINDGDSNNVGVLIYDISSPLAPKVAGFRQLDGPGFGPAEADSNFLTVTSDGYAVMYGFRLAIFDLRDPKNITMTYGSTSYPHVGVSAAAAVVRGQYAYVATQPYCAFGNCGPSRPLSTDVWDISDKQHPKLVRALPVVLSPTSYNAAADSPAGPVFVGADNSVRILDLKRPTAPTLRYRLPLLTSADAVATTATKAVFDDNGFAYLVGGSHGFSIVNPRTLAPVGRFDSAVSPTLPVDQTDIAIQGHRLYYLDDLGFSIVDARVRSRPVLVSHIDLPQAEGVGKVAVAGNRAYVATATTIRIYDISHDAHPVLIGTHAGLSAINGVAARGNELYVTAQTSPTTPFKLNIYDARNAATLPLQSSTMGCNSSAFTADGLTVTPRGDRAYLSSTGCGRVDIVDTAHPTKPSLLKAYTPPGAASPINGVTVVDSRLIYVTTGTGVDLVDLTPTAGPQRLRHDEPLPSSVARLSRSPRGLLMYFSYREEGTAVFSETLPAGHGQPAATGDGRFTALDLTTFDTSHGQLTLVPAVRKNDVVEVMLEMSGVPAALRVPAGTARTPLAQAEQSRSRIQLKSSQDAIVPLIRQHGGQVVAQLQSVYDGVQVRVHQQQIAALSHLPGVIAVHLLHPLEPANTHGVPFVGAPAVWGNYAKTGKGVKIGIIDSGIDYTHADFGGAGTVAAYDYAHAEEATDPAKDPALAKEFGPRAPKVKGGWDFVGDAYNAADPQSTPQPDSNPLDCGGHGSHVSGTAAGFGVLRNGATYRGSYDAHTVSGHDWKVGPGVAPQADLYAYRVFGCTGSSNVVAAAIDKAVADGMDVLNISLGSDMGGVDDPTTVAAENAAKAGLTVVAAAGNAGQNAYVTGSPATGNHVLAVAALDASLPTYPGAALSFSTGSKLDALNANGGRLTAGALPVVVLGDGAGGIGLGCDPADYDPSLVAGALVVTKRGSCARVDRAIYGQQAGAAAVLMINDTADSPPYEGPITTNPDTLEKVTVTIPFLGVPGTAANAAALAAADGATVTLRSQSVVNVGYEHSASFSSGGPRSPDSAPKPEVIAPGVSIESAGVGTGSGSLVDSGTSMATPMTAGVAALVKSAHPAWTGFQIKAAIQNTASPSLDTDYQVRIAGTGVVQAQRAVNSTVLATTADGLNSLAFGLVPGARSVSSTKAFTLTNTGTAAATYALYVEKDGNQRGASVTVTPATVTVAPGAKRTVTATLSMPARAFAALPGVDTSVVGPGQLTSVSGAIVALPVSRRSNLQTLRVSYLLVPRGLSDVVPGTPSAFRYGSASLPVTNRGIHAGAADVYAWGVSDPRDLGGGSADLRAAGVQSLPGSALGGSAADRSLIFAVNTWGAAANRSVDEVDIAVDNNQDGWVDYFVIAVDLGLATNGHFSGQLADFIVDANTYEVEGAYTADAPMNGSTLELPALAGDLGVDTDFQRLDYTLTGTDLQTTGAADSTATASFNPFHPTVSSGQFETVGAGQQLSLPLTFDSSSQRRHHDALGWLLVSVDDGTGAAQADEIAAPEAAPRPGSQLDAARSRPGSGGAGPAGAVSAHPVRNGTVG